MKQRAALHLVSDDGDAELYVARPARARRPRRIDLTRLAADPGRELKRLRRSARASLPQVERETRIGVRYLEALESNATAEAFPAALYARGFLREYARYLRVDPEPILAVHPATRETPEPTVLGSVLAPPVKPRTRMPQWLIPSVCGIALLILLLSTGGHGESPAAAKARSSPAGHASLGLEPGVAGPAVAPPTQAPATETVPARDITVELRTVGSASWVGAKADGKTSVEQNLRPGVTLRFVAERRVDLRLGNASAARLVVNGHAIALGASTGKVVTLRITLVDGRVIVRTANGDLIAQI
jgi:helix-turn-helix protein/uncharacterized protein DUF4115